MQYSLLNAVRNLPSRPYPLQDVYAEAIADAELAEELGFVRSWYGEHHFRECQWTGSPIQLCTAVAARTSRIRVGTAVALMPFHDPRRLAEDVAVCDIISGGRFDFGVGPGSQWEEFVTFGVPSTEMFGRTWEAVDWIAQAFASSGEFSHKGRYYEIPDMTFTTKPVQSPVPMWYGGMGPKNQAHAAKRGMGFIGPFNPGYDQQLAAAGRNPADHPVASMQMVFVSDSADKAWEIAGPALEYFVNFYETRKDLHGVPADPSKRVTADMIRHGQAGFWSAACGSPDDVVKALAPFAAGALGRITELALQLRHAGLRTPEVHRSMRLFVEHVKPALDDIAAKSTTK